MSNIVSIKIGYVFKNANSYITQTYTIMKEKIYIIIILGLLIFFPQLSKAQNIRYISELQRLIDSNIAYDSIAPIDSVILWGQQVSPELERGNKSEMFFRVKRMVVSLYALRGDIGQAIDEARLMYEKAEELNYDLGFALSSVAIGDAYFCSNMPEQAINSYKEAISYPVKKSRNYFYKESTIINLISLLLANGEMQEVEKYREMLTAIQLGSSPNTSSQLLAFAVDVAYYIKKGNLEKAGESFKSAEQVYMQNNQPYLRATYLFMKGEYNEAIGNYEIALQCYDTILKGIKQKMRSINYLHLAYIKANLLEKMGNKKEAVPVYEEISMITDSIVAPSYAHRINTLRASFRENRMKVDLESERNRLFMEIILLGTGVLAIIVYLTFYISKQNKQIAASRVRLEQSQRALENAIQTKSLFLSNMSHEIRTPLSAISGFSALLTDKGLDRDTRRQCGEVIQQNSDLLLKLINDVIDLSNLGLGKMKFKLGYYDAIAICHNVIETVNKVKQTQAEVIFKTSLDALKLYTDDSRLQQLLINLLINSTKFTASGSITLEVSRQSDTTALFSVTDTGCGIPLEQQSKIFNRFEKLNEGVQGTGLGLSICQLIIERIGGTIWIDSEYISGCRFYFTHPINPTKQGKEL